MALTNEFPAARSGTAGNLHQLTAQARDLWGLIALVAALVAVAALILAVGLVVAALILNTTYLRLIGPQ